LINVAFAASGDRSHIPDHARPIFEVLSSHLNRMKQATPPQQKRIVDDLERRIGSLFDSLNCETLSDSVVDQLLVLVKGEYRKDDIFWAVG
jgi:protein transport protein SEC31